MINTAPISYRNAAATRWMIFALIGSVVTAAMLAGLWMAEEKPGHISPNAVTEKARPKVSSPEASTHLSAQTQLATEALKRSDTARQFRQISEIEKRIAFLYEKTPTLTEAEAFEVLSAAGDDPSSKVRGEALLVLENVPVLSSKNIFLAAMAEDSDASVKDYAFQAITSAEMAERIEILGMTLQSQNEDTMRRSAQTLGIYRTKSALEALLKGFETGAINNERKQIILNALTKCINQSFSDPQQAKKWWEENKCRYADDLALISPS